MRHNPASGAIIVMLRSLKMQGMAQAVGEDMYTPRADNGEWTHFSLPQTIETSCTIE